MDDQRLGEERLHKPARMEQDRVVPAVENVQHHEERQVIEDRADRADKQNKTQDLVNRPMARLGQPLRIHLVGGDGGLREVVQEIVDQHLDRQHGKERQERAGPDDAEHVAEVRTGRHFDVLDNVAEDPPAFQHALLQYQQAVFQQDDIGRLLGDVHRAVHRNAHIGGPQGRGVVDAVAHEPQHMALALELTNDTLLVSRDQPGKDAGGACGFGKLRLTHRLDLRAEQEMLYRHPHFLADVGGDDLVIAGQDLDVHAQVVKTLQRLRSGVLWRIEESQETQQDQVRLILDRVHQLIRGARHLLVSQGNHPEALTVQIVRQLPAFGIVLGQNLDDLPFDFHPTTHAHHLIHRALANQRVQPGFIFNNHRHPAPHEVERDLVDFAVLLFRFQAFFQLLVVEDRFIEQVLQSGMVVAVQVAVMQ